MSTYNVNFCGEGTACSDPDENGIFTCSPITAPSVRSAKGYYDASTGLIGFWKSAVLILTDVESVFVELLDANGEGVASSELPFDRVDVTDERFSAVLSFRLQTIYPSSKRGQHIDAEGLRRSLANIASMRLPRDVSEEGDACDPFGARARCVGDAIASPQTQRRNPSRRRRPPAPATAVGSRDRRQSLSPSSGDSRVT